MRFSPAVFSNLVVGRGEGTRSPVRTKAFSGRCERKTDNGGKESMLSVVQVMDFKISFEVEMQTREI